MQNNTLIHKRCLFAPAFFNIPGLALNLAEVIEKFCLFGASLLQGANPFVSKHLGPL
jgi:hypothetical protein